MRDRITDPRRVAQLLASEVEGRERGPLGGLSVTDADREAEPSPTGTRAYVVACDGRAVDVVLYPDRVAVEGDPTLPPVARDHDLPVADGAATVPDGAAVKRAADALAAWCAAGRRETL